MSAIVSFTLMIKICYHAYLIDDINNKQLNASYFGIYIIFSEYIPFSALLLSTLFNIINVSEHKIKESDVTNE